jgi:hypothetical protein
LLRHRGAESDLSGILAFAAMQVVTATQKICNLAWVDAGVLWLKM